jgi:hypothetical protein
MSLEDEAIKIVNEMIKQTGDLGIPTADMVLDCYTRVWSTLYIQSSKNGYGNCGPKNEAKPIAAATPEDDPIVAALKSMDGWGYPDKIAKALKTTESAIVPLIENALANGKIYQAKKGYYSLNDKPKK